jgi:signal transduction histidine kinase
MHGPPSPRSPLFWFIPALLSCVLVLSGLCLFLIRGQARTQESFLREQERLSLDQTQQRFRQEIETRYQTAVRDFPKNEESHAGFRRWDDRLGDSIFGFWLDDSGLLIYPNFQLIPSQSTRAEDFKKTLTAALSDSPDSRRIRSASQPGLLSQEEAVRRMLAAAEKLEREKAISLAFKVLTDSNESWLSGGNPASLAASVVLLEVEESSERTIARQASLVEQWLNLYEGGQLSLSSNALPWLKRLQEQCRRRNEAESWLIREKRVARLVRQIEWAERFLPRLNLLLRRQLYNAARAELPTQVLTSDPAEQPFLVLCRFENLPSMRVIGIVVDLPGFCQAFEAGIDKADWRPAEILVRILRQDSSNPAAPTQQLSSGMLASERPPSASQQEPPDKLSSQALREQRILDPWAPQFLVEAGPRDFKAFEQRTLQKNLLYLILVALTIATCGLVLFLGNRAFQEQHRLSKLRTDFLSNVSHELRTPLTAIRLHAETLERQLPKKKSAATSSLDTIVGEVDRLGLLINDVLEFTRLENQKKRYLWESVDLVSVIRDSLQLFSQQLAELEFELSLDLPGSIVLPRGDRAALKQCAVNLISNCIKFSPGDKYLSIKLSVDRGQALWEIEDRGIGVSPEDRPHIFEKFYRGRNLDPAFSGTGLGLTLCKAFVEAHEGTITCEEPQSGTGSRFVIRLPMSTELS